MYKGHIKVAQKSCKGSARNLRNSHLVFDTPELATTTAQQRRPATLVHAPRRFSNAGQVDTFSLVLILMTTRSCPRPPFHFIHLTTTTGPQAGSGLLPLRVLAHNVYDDATTTRTAMGAPLSSSLGDNVPSPVSTSVTLVIDVPSVSVSVTSPSPASRQQGRTHNATTTTHRLSPPSSSPTRTRPGPGPLPLPTHNATMTMTGAPLASPSPMTQRRDPTPLSALTRDSTPQSPPVRLQTRT